MIGPFAARFPQSNYSRIILAVRRCPWIAIAMFGTVQVPVIRQATYVIVPFRVPGAELTGLSCIGAQRGRGSRIAGTQHKIRPFRDGPITAHDKELVPKLHMAAELPARCG